MKEIVRIENLSTGYGKQKVLDNISLKVYEGEKVVIMGPSGSGKSTLLKSIVKLVEPWSGKIFLNGFEVTSPNIDIRKIRQMTGFVFQNYNLFPHMTVLKNILLPLRIVKKMSKENALKQAIKVLKEVNMLEFKDKYPLQLSGGQQQRVAIARALAMNPIVLLLDEPTSALDPDLRDEVLNTLRKIANEGIAMIIVTHEVDFAIDVADRIVFMDKGRILEVGRPREIIYKTKSDMIKRYLKSIHVG
ncbi:MAG TPA: amino acid ABC transporter ATP-binding protein [Thermoprotei archaeon]|nr:amino acid ABC transporter ATP-binding protein [Thermoprotei archaeon]